MTGEELKELTTSILDGEVIDDDFFYQLLNIAKTKLEEKRVWQFLKKLDSSKSASLSAIPLPSDFALDYKLEVGLRNEYTPCDFEEQHIYRNSSNRYYLDIASDSLYLTGTNPTGTVYLFYKRFTPAITEATEPVFPERFHPILAYFVAGYFQVGVDADDTFARMSPENKVAALELQGSMEMWDTQLKMRSQNHQIGVADSEPTVDVGNM